MSELKNWLACMAGGSALLLGHIHAYAVPLADPAERPARMTPRATHAVLTGVTRAGQRLIAVGEHGIILVSDDEGAQWRQVPVPVAVTLTAARFVNTTEGWVVGHSGVVLHSSDGGLSWERQLDGKRAAQLILEAAQAHVTSAGADDVAARKQLELAKQFSSDGSDKPFLDLHFHNAREGYVIGAYGLIFSTSDGGKSWKPWLNHVENPAGLNLYAMAGEGDSLYIAGEQGLFLRSQDGGEHFSKVGTPYRGTWFALSVLDTGEIVLAGLRGNVYVSTDHGASFSQSAVPVPVSFNSMSQSSHSSLLFVNQAGQLLISQDRGRSIQPVPLTQSLPLTAAIELDDHAIVVIGMRGPLRLPGINARFDAASVSDSTAGKDGVKK